MATPKETYSQSLASQLPAAGRMSVAEATNGLGHAVDRLESAETLLKVIYSQALSVCHAHPEDAKTTLLHSTITLALNMVEEWKFESDELIGKWLAAGEREAAKNGK